MTTVLLLYAYSQGVSSSRQIERRGQKDLAFMYPTADDAPDHDTICGFRRAHLAAFTTPFVEALLLTPIGIVTLVAVCVPGICLTILACRRAPRRCVVLCGAWAAFGFLPLLLPVTTPEAYHLSVALAAVFVLWASQPLSKAFVVAMVAWLLIHGWARERLFYHDLPIIAKVVDALERVRHDPRSVMINTPIQVGPHYAMLPDMGFRGCFADPLWIWTSRADGGLEYEKAAARRIVESGTSFIRLCR